MEAKVPSAQPKVRISEEKAKEKTVFLLLFRAKVLSATAKGTNPAADNTDLYGYGVCPGC
jgi:hypothetical protein